MIDKKENTQQKRMLMKKKSLKMVKYSLLAVSI